MSALNSFCIEDVYPEKEWMHKTPKELGVEGKKLKTIENYLGGRGFISYKVYFSVQFSANE